MIELKTFDKKSCADQLSPAKRTAFVPKFSLVFFGRLYECQVGTERMFA